MLGTLTFAYDTAGNPLKQGGTWAATGIPQPSWTTSVNANNQLLALGPTTLTYDFNGNLTTATASTGTATYTWDARNRLRSISAPGLTASFQYDAMSRRTTKIINGTTTSFLYDGLNPVQELSGTTPTANLLTGFGIDEFFTRTDAAGARAVLPNAVGSTIAVADNTGTVQTSYTYEPFGNATTAGAVSTNSFQYTWRENDGTGLHYYRARYYSPQLQRFISEDPLGFAGGDVNCYSYARNSPTTFRDPLGLIINQNIPPSLQFPLQQVRSTERGHVLYDMLEQSPSTYTIREPNPGEDPAFYNPNTNEIVVDPSYNYEMVTEIAGRKTKINASIPRVLGHEMGHAETGFPDMPRSGDPYPELSGPQPGPNVIYNENPIAEGLHEPPRVRY